MPDMHHINTSIEDYEKEAIRSSIASAEQQFTDGLVKGSALRSKGASFGAAG
jgi:hypothetical protein